MVRYRLGPHYFPTSAKAIAFRDRAGSRGYGASSLYAPSFMQRQKGWYVDITDTPAGDLY